VGQRAPAREVSPLCTARETFYALRAPVCKTVSVLLQILRSTGETVPQTKRFPTRPPPGPYHPHCVFTVFSPPPGGWTLSVVSIESLDPLSIGNVGQEDMDEVFVKFRTVHGKTVWFFFRRKPLLPEKWTTTFTVVSSDRGELMLLETRQMWYFCNPLDRGRGASVLNV